LLGLKGGEKVLEIGTGSGYQAIVLSLMGAKVFSVERFPELNRFALSMFEAMNTNGIEARIGDGSTGWPEHMPFDAILATAGAPSIPGSLVRQLKSGGRLVIPIGRKTDQQRMVRATKNNSGEMETEVFGDFRFVPLIGEQGWK
jgi:protein-L-isoaspartate(D-aspartate) O-methyltransferase